MSIASLSVARLAAAAALVLSLGHALPAAANSPGPASPTLAAVRGEPNSQPVQAPPALPASPAVVTAAPNLLMVRPHTSEAGTTMLFWNGPVVLSMPSQIWAAYQEHKATSRRFVLVLNSGGGSVHAGEQVITVLRGIATTHRLDTEVRNGRLCGSMCVFIYLQGQTRTAAPTSAWLFHEITRTAGPDSKALIIDRARWDQLIAHYYPPAGVSYGWTQAMKPHTINSDYWLTGRELVDARSGIVTHMLGNTQARSMTPGGGDAP